jgi:histidine triad (HIT) family protein
MTPNDPGLDPSACPFCGMVRGEVEAHRIYSDALVFAILDRRPINPYHLLVIPNVHMPDFYDLDDAIYAHLMQVAQSLARVVKLLAAPTKVGLLIAGFDVPHTHVHVIPLHDYHDVTSRRLLDRTLAPASTDELSANAARLTAALRSGQPAREGAH